MKKPPKKIYQVSVDCRNCKHEDFIKLIALLHKESYYEVPEHCFPLVNISEPPNFLYVYEIKSYKKRVPFYSGFYEPAETNPLKTSLICSFFIDNVHSVKVGKP